MGAERASPDGTVRMMVTVTVTVTVALPRTLSLPERRPAGAGAAAPGQLLRREIKVLVSEARALVRPRRFAALGHPRDRSVAWCRAALELLVAEAQWAPEEDWAPGPTVQLRFRLRDNAIWVQRAVARAEAAPATRRADGT